LGGRVVDVSVALGALEVSPVLANADAEPDITARTTVPAAKSLLNFMGICSLSNCRRFSADSVLRLELVRML
jgi:hypothetical protein